ncbi:MAG TPA: orotidine-5'-phosphate decarboxylase [Bacteroidota bacterium]|jgi:orotidine-5'-phosphate decarboxylase|nr:orotidine-5'-phosphate decarboxylase [Bacteroidota bacterium]
MTFLQKLNHIQRKNDSLLCIGLDTDVSRIPESLFKWEDPQYEFNRRIIDATKDIVCAYKMNIAFYESVGEHGWYTVHHTLARIPEEIVTIGDGKRGDIANSAEHQAHLLCADWEFAATTVSPYMGKDSVEPFMKRKDQCAFVLAVTSNKGSKDFQQLRANGKPMYEHVVNAAKRWNTKKNVGLVVGATKPAQLKRIRSLAPAMPILIPGAGAQRGDLEASVRYGCDKHGGLAIINVGRSIIYASEGDDFAEQARAAAIRYREQINKYRGKYFK